MSGPYGAGASGEKHALRGAALAARRAVPAGERAAGDAARDRALAGLLAGGRVAAYAAFGSEPATAGLLAPDTLLPVVRPDRDLDWVRAGGGPALGVDAVGECDLVLVPALAVDRRGVRLGRGGGSYDRALPRARGLVVALLHEGELVQRSLPAEPHDARVHAAALPSGLVRLGPCRTVQDRRVDFDDVLTANAAYADRFEGADLPGRAGSGLAVLTCMDSRIDPLGMLGLRRGDAKVLRNPGARVTDEVLRSLVLAVALLGVERVLVVAHTDCGMARATDEQVQQAVRDRTGLDARSVDFGTVRDQRSTLERDVQRVRSWPFLPALPVAGAVYDVRTGRLDLAVPPGPRDATATADPSAPVDPPGLPPTVR